MPPVNTYGGLTDMQRNSYSGSLLSRFLPELMLYQWGKKDSIPRREGKTREWRYVDSFPRAITPLTEGVPPAALAINTSKVTATTDQYGAWTKLTDLLVHQAIDPLWTEMSLVLGEQAGQTIHSVISNTLAGGTNVRYADGVANRAAVAAANVMDAAEIRRAKRILRRQNVRGFRARNRGWVMYTHTDIEESLMADTTILSIAQYGAGGTSKQDAVSIIDGTVTQFGGFDIYYSTEAPVFPGAGSGGIDVFGTLSFGPEWYGLVDLAAKPVGGIGQETNKLSGIQIKGVPVDTETKDDPLGQFGTIGWKVLGFVAVILQQQRGLRTESAAAA